MTAYRRSFEDQEISAAHILYLKAGSPSRIADLLGTVPEGTLTVADSDGAHPRGSVLSFFLDEGRVRFGVSLEAAARQKLRLSSKLITIPRQVQSAVQTPSQQA